MDMPRYRSHKTVSALEIKSAFRRDDDGVLLTFANDYPSFVIAGSIAARYMPVEGDFFLKYEDGYISISPRKAFLDGYAPESTAAHVGLPVAGYKPQNQAAVDAVNLNKQLEEQVLRQIDALNDPHNPLATDPRWIAVGRRHIEQGFMELNRAVFKPGRAKLPGDA